MITDTEFRRERERWAFELVCKVFEEFSKGTYWENGKGDEISIAHCDNTIINT